MSACSSQPVRIWLTVTVLLSLPVALTHGAEESSSSAVPSKSAEHIYFERVVRKVEPGLAGAADRLPLYLHLFQRELINDPRLFPCRVEVESLQDGQLVLTGVVGFEENRTALEGLLRFLGFNQIDDRIEVLPSKGLGEKRFGLVRTTHSFSFDSPSRGEVLTDCLLGTPLFLLKETDGYFLCHGVEGYVGYVAGQDIHRVDAEQFTEYQAGLHVRMRQNHTTDIGLTLPMGARLRLVEQEHDRITVALPDGSEATIPADSRHVDGGTADPRIERVIKAAESLLGTQYVWGGNTSDGIDCSGLVQTSFATEGIILARDSNQQVFAGRLVATRWHRDGLRRGDTLYFLGKHGKIRHTGIYLGNQRYIEAVSPVVRYSSFDPASREYSKRGDAMFCFGKRIVE